MGTEVTTETWVSLTEAAKRRGCGMQTIQRAAMDEQVRRLLLPGKTPLYHMEDVMNFPIANRGRRATQMGLEQLKANEQYTRTH